MTKIPVFDTGNTLAPFEDDVNQTVKMKLNQAGITDVPDFPVEEYSIFRPEEVEEWLEENEVDMDPEKMSLAALGSRRRFFQRKSIVETLEELSQEHGPIGFVSGDVEEVESFYEGLFEETEVDWQGFKTAREGETPEELFEAFLEERDEDASEFVYFSNSTEMGEAAENAGMKFVWVTQYKTSGSNEDVPTVERFNKRNIEQHLQD